MVPAGWSAIELSSGQGTLNLEEWHHVAGTYDGTTMRVYLDGVEKATYPVSASAIDYEPPNDLNIGLYVDDNESYYFNGQIDEVRIWNRTLSPETIKAGMGQGLNGRETGLVGYWNFDSLTADGRVLDLSGKGNHGAIVGGAELVASGAPVRAAPMEIPAGDKALSLDGVDGFVGLGRSAVYQVGSNLTVEAWINASSQVQWAGIVGNIWDTGSTEGGYNLSMDGFSGVYFGLVPAGSAEVDLSTGQGSLSLGEWHHIAGTYDGAMMRVYLDGVEKATYAVSASAIDYEPPNDMNIGLYIDDNEAHYFSGQIDEVRIWKRTLSPAEIKANMGRSLTGKETGLVGYWNFDQITDQGQVVDLTANANRGTLAGGARLVSSTRPGAGTAAVSAPVAAFTASVASGTAPLTVQFTNASTGTGNTYAWSFGDGGTGTSANISHTFTAAGTYTVRLTATNAGGTHSATRTITVKAAVTAPVASFTASVASGTAPLTVQFTNTSTGTGNTYAWSFGDGGTGTTASISHTFTAAGTYTVRLTATNAGGTHGATRTITVTAPARLFARAIVGGRRVGPPVSAEAGSALRFEVSTFTKADSSDRQLVTDYTWRVPTRLGTASALGQLTVATAAGVADSIVFQRQGQQVGFRVSVVAGPVAKIAITPANATVAAGKQQQFTAEARDRYNNRVSGQTFSWYVVGNIGTITSTGLFTAAKTAGRGFIIAATIANGSIVFGDNGTAVSGTAKVVVGPPGPEQVALHQNVPNPFNPATEIRFELPEDGPVRLAVYNLVGQQIAVLADRPFPAGAHVVRWDASNQPSGTYLYVLEAGGRRQERKMLLLR